MSNTDIDIKSEILNVVRRTQEEIIRRYEVYVEEAQKLAIALMERNYENLDTSWDERQKMLEEVNYIFEVFKPVEEWFSQETGERDVSFTVIKNFLKDSEVDSNFEQMQVLLSQASEYEKKIEEQIRDNLSEIQDSLKRNRKSWQGLKRYNEYSIEMRKNRRKAHFIDKKG